MALNGNISVEVTPNNCDVLVFSWEANQDQSANISTINWTMTLVADKNYGTLIPDDKTKDWIVTIDGKQTTGTADITINKGESKVLATGMTVVNHEPDGTKTLDLGVELNVDITGWGGSSGTQECPECGGTTLDGDGNECPVCNGTGEIAGSSGTSIGWVRGSATVELDPITGSKKYDIKTHLNGYIMGIATNRIKLK